MSLWSRPIWGVSALNFASDRLQVSIGWCVFLIRCWMTPSSSPAIHDRLYGANVFSPECEKVFICFVFLLVLLACQGEVRCSLQSRDCFRHGRGSGHDVGYCDCAPDTHVCLVGDERRLLHIVYYITGFLAHIHKAFLSNCDMVIHFIFRFRIADFARKRICVLGTESMGCLPI